MSQVIHVDGDSSFDQEVLRSQTPVLVDFWAEWCGPCKAVGPIVDAAAESHSGKIKVTKVNVDNNQALAVRYGIRGIPTLLLFRNGEVVGQQVGAVSGAQLDAFINQNL